MATAIDLFAGLGGFTEAGRMCGLDVVWAANHWPVAVEFHAANHPEVIHVCQDLRQANWCQVPGHDVLLASPACQGHSRARGKDRPHHDATRSTAWAVVDCVEAHKPRLAIVENVPDFLNWSLFPAWKLAMETLGYAIAPHIVDCADLGVPQNRERVFIVCTRSKAPLKLSLPKLSHKPVMDLIEWGQHSWRPVETKRRSLATLARVARGRSEFGERFVMPYYGNGSGLTGRCLSRPLGTVTTRDRWAIVDGDRMRMFQPSEYRNVMTFPNTYQLPKTKKTAVHLLGNAVPPVAAAHVIQAAMGAV
ncbi:MAG: DNA cytosine methyltransferase [Candidatus Thiodiazotropha endolucinida]|nr:DNA cytosine methyltransferase [Candidatus Thiodiazotropha taylori]MCW4268093.1 DNA cytosine methyltransferase [Candidatus Thiodiazotropha endolucinida]